MKRYAWLVPAVYIVFVLLPIYWLLNMSFKTTNEILGSFTLWPQEFTFDNYRKIFTDPTWYRGYLNSISYVAMNTVLSVTVALPAAYAFSRYRFLGDKHLFFWLLTNRMAPPAVFALPFFQLYSAIGLFDTRLAVALAHCLFNIPLAVWILSFMSSVPKELDETVRRRLSVLALFHSHLHSDHRGRHSGGGVLLLHVLVGGAFAGEDAVGRLQADRGNDDAHREHVGLRTWAAGRGRR